MTEREATRAQFEALSEGMRSKKIGIGVNAASGAYTGFTIGGPVGAAVGGALGVLIGYWGMKSYRARVYAELEAAGLIKKRRTMSRSTLYRLISGEPGFLRFPYSETVGYAVIDVLTKHNPEMSEQEINAEAYAVAKTFHEFRRNLPDIPLEIAAEVILTLNGIRRNPDTGEYEPFDFVIPEEQPPIYRLQTDREREAEKAKEALKTEVKIAWGLAGAAVFIYLMRGNK